MLFISKKPEMVVAHAFSRVLPNGGKCNLKINIEEIKKALNYYNARGNVHGSFIRYPKQISFENQCEIVRRVNGSAYSFSLPLKRIVPKNHGGTRTVYFYSLEDYLVQRVVTESLWEKVFANDKIVFSYITGRGPSRMIQTMAREIENNSFTCLARIDVKDYSNSISHSRLKKIIEQRINDKDIVNLMFDFLENGISIEGRKGINSGSIFANFFADLYLIDLDDWIEAKYCNRVFRYSDDLFILGRSFEEIRKIRDSIATKLSKEFGLCIHSKKKDIASEESLDDTKYFDFAFYSFNGNEIRVKEKTIQIILEELHAIIESETEMSSAVKKINYYFSKKNNWKEYENDCFFLALSICNDIKQFAYIDSRIHKEIARKYCYSNDYKDEYRKLICLRKMYYYVKKRQRYYAGLKKEYD